MELHSLPVIDMPDVVRADDRPRVLAQFSDSFEAFTFIDAGLKLFALESLSLRRQAAFPKTHPRHGLSLAMTEDRLRDAPSRLVSQAVKSEKRGSPSSAAKLRSMAHTVMSYLSEQPLPDTAPIEVPDFIPFR